MECLEGFFFGLAEPLMALAIELLSILGECGYHIVPISIFGEGYNKAFE